MTDRRVTITCILVVGLLACQFFDFTPLAVHASDDDVVILCHSYYRDKSSPQSGDWYSYIVGEVQNQGSNNVLFVGVLGTFYDEDDNILAIDFEYIDIDILEPGQASPFLLRSYPLANLPVDHYTVTVSRYDVTSETVYREFQIRNDELLFLKAEDYRPFVQGTVENTGQHFVSKCKVLATLYNTEGIAIGTGRTFITDMSVGSSNPFLIGFYSYTLIEPASYQIKVTTFASNRIVTCTVTLPIINLNSNISVSGALIPDQADDTVTLNYTAPDGTVILRNVTTSSDGYGRYNDTYTLSRIGEWRVQASWDGDATYAPSTSSHQTILVTKIPSNLSCSVSTTLIDYGTSLSIAGAITPQIEGTSIIINYTSPDEQIIRHEILTSDGGQFTDSLTPEIVGTWIVDIFWAGNDEYLNTTSHVTFTVQDSGIPFSNVLMIGAMLIIIIIMFIRRQ